MWGGDINGQREYGSFSKISIGVREVTGNISVLIGMYRDGILIQTPLLKVVHLRQFVGYPLMNSPNSQNMIQAPT